MPIKVLLIEDNNDHVLLAQKILQRADGDYVLDSVKRAKKGLDKMSQTNYDVILCDYRLPDANALEVLKEAKRQISDVPFVVITSAGSEKIAVELMKQGAYDYLVKDSSYESILPAVIDRSFRRHKDVIGRRKAEESLKVAYEKLKETQEELIQSSKMAAMGQLAAGISHELNQPLTGIKGFAQAALMDLDKDNPLQADLSKIVEQADRMDTIIKNVQFFAKKSEFKMRPIDINKPIQDAFMFLEAQLKVHNIKLVKFLAKNLPKVQADPNQLQQAFLNLLTNARDAIDSTKRHQGGQISVQTLLDNDNKSIEVIFKDDGCGISKKTLEHIFNPFFTTKSPDGGMGLGLSIVYRIVNNHKGKITVGSKEPEGTSFKINFPFVEEEHIH
ncbi:MAG: ATP-binding protein [Omnitrophica bacterium]|nr:ATP-binding protein [Candidatus Omnitrophota bacterium]